MRDEQISEVATMLVATGLDAILPVAIPAPVQRRKRQGRSRSSPSSTTWC
jgi:hypothetical protein